MSKKIYGLTSTGFKIPSLDELINTLEASMVDKIGALDFKPPSVIGSYNLIIAEAILIMWEGLQDVFYSNFAKYATNISLDYAVAMNNIARQKATPTTVICQLSADNYTAIEAGSKALLKNTNTTFSLQNVVTISNNRCYSISLAVIDTTLTEYIITINSNQIKYTKVEDDTDLSIITAFSHLINDAGQYVSADILNDTLIITTTDLEKTFSCYMTEGLQILQVTNNAIFVCDEVGNLTAPSHSITEIQTPIDGWNSIDNITSGIVGKNIETDIELRDRFSRSQSINSAGTDPAIRSRLLQVQNVTAVRVISDRINHTLNALVIGGKDIDVATCLHLTRPCGIEMLGNTEISVTDIEGNPHLIKFTRPECIYIYVSIDLTTNDLYVEDATIAIKNKIINYVNALGVETIVAYQALFAAIYSISGVVEAVVKIGGTTIEDVIPTLESKNINITNSQVPFTDAAKITINIS